MRIVDLFSGAGGLTFGFYYNLINGQFVRNENCDIIFANEFDHAAAEAFRMNFPDINMIERDIKKPVICIYHHGGAKDHGRTGPRRLCGQRGSDA